MEYPATYVCRLPSVDTGTEEGCLKTMYAILGLSENLPEINMFNTKHSMPAAGNIFPGDIVIPISKDTHTYKEFVSLYKKHEAGISGMIATDRSDLTRIGFMMMPKKVFEMMQDFSGKGNNSMIAVTVYNREGDMALSGILVKLNEIIKQYEKDGVYKLD